MVMTDPIADLLTIIRNGLLVKKETVNCPFSSTKEDIIKVLIEEGYISNYKVMDTPPGKTFRIFLKYGPHGEKVITKLERVSKPGRRIFSPIKDLKPVLNGLGISILSTPRGVLSDRKARAENVGGEVLCQIW